MPFDFKEDFSEASKEELMSDFEKLLDTLLEEKEVEGKESQINDTLYAMEKRFEDLHSDEAFNWDDWKSLYPKVSKSFRANKASAKDIHWAMARLGRHLVNEGEENLSDEHEEVFEILVKSVEDHLAYIRGRFSSEKGLTKEKYTEEGREEGFNHLAMQNLIGAFSASPPAEFVYKGKGIGRLMAVIGDKYMTFLEGCLEYVLSYASALAYQVGEGDDLAAAVIDATRTISSRLVATEPIGGESFDFVSDVKTLNGLSGCISSFGSAPSVSPQYKGDIGLVCRLLKIGTATPPAKFKKDVKDDLESLNGQAATALMMAGQSGGGTEDAGPSGNIDDLKAMLDVVETAAKKIPPTAIYSIVEGIKNCGRSPDAQTLLYSEATLRQVYTLACRDPMKSGLNSWLMLYDAAAQHGPDGAATTIDVAVQATQKLAQDANFCGILHTALGAFGKLARQRPDAGVISTAEKAKGQVAEAVVPIGIFSFCKGMLQGNGKGHADNLRIVQKMLTTAKNLKSPDTMLPSFMMEAVAVLRVDKGLITPEFRKFVEDLKNRPGAYALDSQAIAFIDELEGRTLEKLEGKIEAQNAKIKEACKDFDSLKNYLDENVAELKEFVGDVVKKLPIPVRFAIERKLVVLQQMILFFQCPYKDQTQKILGGEDSAYECELKTTDWNKWLKVAVSAVKIGKSVVSMDALVNPVDAVDQVKDVYSAFTKKGDEEFLAFCSEPFLTSKEQDMLVEGLRKHGFFDKFVYDAQTAQWVALPTDKLQKAAKGAGIPATDFRAIGDAYEAGKLKKFGLDPSNSSEAFSPPPKGKEAAGAGSETQPEVRLEEASEGRVVKGFCGWCC